MALRSVMALRDEISTQSKNNAVASNLLHQGVFQYGETFLRDVQKLKLSGKKLADRYKGEFSRDLEAMYETLSQECRA